MNTGAPRPQRTVAQQRVLEIQRKLHKWSMDDQDRRFSDLHNLVCDPATLMVAWLRVRGNRGRARRAWTARRPTTSSRCWACSGSWAHFARSCARELGGQPVRERRIPKRGGKTRRLGIPTLTDRVVQAALKLVLEPIFETDFQPCSYGFRTGRRAQDANREGARLPVAALHGAFRQGYVASLPSGAARDGVRGAQGDLQRRQPQGCDRSLRRGDRAPRRARAEGRRAARGGRGGSAGVLPLPAGALVQAALEEPAGACEPRDRAARRRRWDLPQRRERDPARRRAARSSRTTNGSSVGATCPRSRLALVLDDRTVDANEEEVRLSRRARRLARERARKAVQNPSGFEQQQQLLRQHRRALHHFIRLDSTRSCRPNGTDQFIGDDLMVRREHGADRRDHNIKRLVLERQALSVVLPIRARSLRPRHGDGPPRAVRVSDHSR